MFIIYVHYIQFKSVSSADNRNQKATCLSHITFTTYLTLEEAVSLDSSAADLKFIKNSPKNFNQNVKKYVPQLLCILAHRSRVPSFVGIREKL